MIKKSLLLILMLATALSFATVTKAINVPVEDNIRYTTWTAYDSGDYSYIQTTISIPETTSSINFYTNNDPGLNWGPSFRAWLTESAVVKHSYIKFGAVEYTFNELKIKDYYQIPTLTSQMTMPDDFTINLHDLNGASEYGAVSMTIRIYTYIDYSVYAGGLLSALNGGAGPYFELNYSITRAVYNQQGVVLAERYLTDDTDAGVLPITYPQPTAPGSNYELVGWRTKTGEVYDHYNIQPDWYVEDQDNPNIKILQLYAYYQLVWESTYTPDTPLNNLPVSLATLLDAVGFNNATGYIILFIALLLLVTVGMSFGKLGALPILIIDIVIYGLFIYFGILPVFAIILFGALYVLAFLLIVNRRSTA